MAQVISNGSKWAGAEPDSIDILLELMACEPLNPLFEQYGNFLYAVDGEIHIWGNFLNVSHVFDIRTNDSELVRRFAEAIDANQASAAYQAANKENNEIQAT